MPDAGQGNKGAGPSWTHGSGGCWAGGLPRPSNHGPSRATIRTHMLPRGIGWPSPRPVFPVT